MKDAKPIGWMSCSQADRYARFQDGTVKCLTAIPGLLPSNTRRGRGRAGVATYVRAVDLDALLMRSDFGKIIAQVAP